LVLHRIEIETKKRVEIIDITKVVQEKVWESDLHHGIVLVFTKHTTTGLLINEAERNLIEDFKDNLARLFPKELKYHHNSIDRNAVAHLSAGLLLNTELMIPVESGELQLGPWQRILFVELDGPRHRKVYVMVCPCPEMPEE